MQKRTSETETSESRARVVNRTKFGYRMVFLFLRSCNDHKSLIFIATLICICMRTTFVLLICLTAAPYVPSTRYSTQFYRDRIKKKNEPSKLIKHVGPFSYT